MDHRGLRVEDLTQREGLHLAVNEDGPALDTQVIEVLQSLVNGAVFFEQLRVLFAVFHPEPPLLHLEKTLDQVRR